MPSTPTRAAPKPRVTRGRPVKAAKPTFQEPQALIEKPQQAVPDRPTEHNGVRIAHEELLSNLPNNKAPFRFTKLILEDGTTAFGCRDCLATADTRGQILLHRNAEHGARNGKRTPRVALAPVKGIIDLVLPPRGDEPAPTQPLNMTLGEFLALAPDIAAMGDLIDRLEAERDAALKAAAENVIDKATQRKIDVYESHRAELVDLRLQNAKWGNYEEIKEELYALRSWKRKHLAKLAKAGIRVEEDE